MSNGSDGRERANPARGLWRAVSVHASAGACPAARRLGDTRFLVAQAPRLPLADCDLPDDCDCVFRHHADRRIRERRSPGGHAGDVYERRILNGRRSTDR